MPSRVAIRLRSRLYMNEWGETVCDDTSIAIARSDHNVARTSTSQCLRPVSKEQRQHMRLCTLLEAHSPVRVVR